MGRLYTFAQRGVNPRAEEFTALPRLCPAAHRVGVSVTTPPDREATTKRASSSNNSRTTTSAARK
jgi:hypothetical protein